MDNEIIFLAVTCCSTRTVPALPFPRLFLIFLMLPMISVTGLLEDAVALVNCLLEGGVMLVKFLVGDSMGVAGGAGCQRRLPRLWRLV